MKLTKQSILAARDITVSYFIQCQVPSRFRGCDENCVNKLNLKAGVIKHASKLQPPGPQAYSRFTVGE